MGIFSYFKKEEKTSASVAKERLQIIVAHERTTRTQPDYLPAMQQAHAKPSQTTIRL